MNRKRIFYTIIFPLLSFYSCVGPTATNDENGWCVSIPPLKYIVENITGKDFPIEVLLPPGATPETYEPTPAQMISLSQSQLIFTTGLLDFEQQLSQRLSEITSENRIVDLSSGITLITGNDAHSHHHGVDPHIWTSPQTLKQMAATAYQKIALLYPDSARYLSNYKDFDKKIDSLDHLMRNRITSSGRKYFLIYHPAFTYMARDYAIEQVSLEDDGKELSADRLRKIVDRARKDGIKKLFYQSQFNQATVATIAAEIGAETVEIDPLEENVIENLFHITKLITE